MRTLGPVDFDNCRFPESAKIMGDGVDAVKTARKCDTGRALELISNESGVHIASIKEMRNGKRDPRRSAGAVSAAIKKLSGLAVVFPSQVKEGGPEEAEEAPKAPPIAVNVPTAARGVRIEITFF